MATIKRYATLYVPLEDGGKVVEGGEEDVFFSGYPFSPFEMVYDGASQRLPDGSKARFANDSTMAKRVGGIVRDVFWQAPNSDGLKEVILRANLQVRGFQESRGIPLDRADLLSGGVFAAIKRGQDILSGIYAGDCFIVVVQKDGGVWATKDQTHESGRREGELIGKALEESGGVRDEIFLEKFSRIVSEFRLKDMNQPRAKNPNAFGILNGQEGPEEHLEEFHIPIETVRCVILGTDGAANFSETENPDVYAQLSWERYQKGGARGIVDGARRAHGTGSYVDYDEATLIAIEFE